MILVALALIVPCVAFGQLQVGGEYRICDGTNSFVCQIYRDMWDGLYEVRRAERQIGERGGMPVYRWKRNTEVINANRFARFVLIRMPSQHRRKSLETGTAFEEIERKYGHTNWTNE